MISQLRNTYRLVLKLKRHPCWSWDDKRGCNIDEDTETLWEAYVNAHADQRQHGLLKFRNAGWPLFDRVAEICAT
jgi:hypothetical protein